MVQYDKQVINKLLDTYENSILSIGQNKRNVKIELRFTKTIVPEYFDESSFAYENIHIQLRNIEEQGLIKIIWKDEKVDYVIQKVQLNIERLTQAYAFVHRTPKCNLEEENQTFLEKYCNDERGEIPVTRQFAQYLQERLNNHQPVKEYINLSKLEETKRLFVDLSSVEKNRKLCYIPSLPLGRLKRSPLGLRFIS